MRGMQVVCIDNDERILEGMKELLGGWGCDVALLTGSGGIEALVAAGADPDIVFADYHLDGETGFDAVARLRETFGQELPAVLVTADRSADVRQEAAQLGIPVLSKPVKPAQLRSMLARNRRMRAAAE